MLAGMLISAPAVKFISPVPCGVIVKSAFDPLLAISFVVSDPAVTPPSIVAPPFKLVAPVIVNVPVALTFLNPDASALLSTTTALLAATVPSVIPSIFSKSVSSMSAEPIINEPPDVIFPDDVIAPVVTAPVISTASAIVIFVESELSSVVPFILNALMITSPVPLGCMLMSAFEPLLTIELVVT